ncbi:MAG: DUF2442 domain-containing protein [Pseudomonadales bacterium]|nr:DUF2442 domain-containing protein [Pseudomonadales bacterium]
MTILAPEAKIPDIADVSLADGTLSVALSDGRRISVPLEWFPRLVHGTLSERGNWRIIGHGLGIHWEELDEDISVEGLLAGRASGESQASFKKWLAHRGQKGTLPLLKRDPD